MITLDVGYGSRQIAATSAGRTRAWHLEIEPRHYWVGRFDEGFYLGWATTFARSIDHPLGFESVAVPPGLATGLFLGGKSTSVPIITPDAALGMLVPLVTPAGEGRPPAIAVVGRLAIGGSF